MASGRADMVLRRKSLPDSRSRRTYVLDLSGITAGTAVNLSFDLIGFGLSASQLGSRVNISDVRLISAPLAVNDTDTLAEDGSASITVQANDLNAEATGFAPRLVASAQHGQVSVNAANGVFSGFVYTPDAKFFGLNTFTYQYRTIFRQNWYLASKPSRSTAVWYAAPRAVTATPLWPT